MPLDMTLAIAKLDNANNLDPLRERYPELGFVFDELDDAREAAADTVSKEDYNYIENELDIVERDRDHEIELRRGIESECVDVASRLSRIIEGMGESIMRTALEEIWHNIPEPR